MCPRPHLPTGGDIYLLAASAKLSRVYMRKRESQLYSEASILTGYWPDTSIPWRLDPSAACLSSPISWLPIEEVIQEGKKKWAGAAEVQRRWATAYLLQYQEPGDWI